MLSQKFVQKEENVIVFFCARRKVKLAVREEKCVSKICSKEENVIVFFCVWRKVKLAVRAAKCFVRFVLRKIKFICVIYAQGK